MGYILNPDLIISPLNEDFFCVVNPCIPNGIKVINRNQHAVLKRIAICDFDENETGDPAMDNFIAAVLKKEFICNGAKFSHPKPFHGKIRNIDFWIHLSDACNLDCPYCSIQTKPRKTYLNAKDTLHIVETIAIFVRSEGITSLSIRFGGGEPLLNFTQVEVIVRGLRSQLPETCRLELLLITNLTLLTASQLDFIAQNDISVCVSLDGTEEYHNRTRNFNGKGSFQLIERNMELLEQRHVPYHISSVISNRNLDGLEEFVEYLIRKNIVFRLSLVRGEEFDFEKAILVFEAVYKTFERHILSGYEFTRYHNLCNLSFFQPRLLTCGSGINSFAIYTNGDLYPCTHRIGDDTLCSGNICTPGLLKNLLTRPFSPKASFHSDCIECKYKYLCTNACPLFHTAGKSVFCEFNQKMIPKVYRLIGLERLQNIKNRK